MNYNNNNNNNLKAVWTWQILEYFMKELSSRHFLDEI